jgi:hypothetical protein
MELAGQLLERNSRIALVTERRRIAPMRRLFGLTLALLVASAPGVFAQATGGNIYGSVADATGAVLPGAAITLSAAGGGVRTTTSGPQGEFRFLSLDPGTYKLTVTLSGFATVTRDVIIATGTSANLAFNLKVATLEESVQVTDETPVVDTKRIGTSTTMSREELHQVPQGRDPWAILKTVPGVIVDRVSVAGNEGGQQSVFAGKGASTADSMWNLDGVQITDTTSGGASSMYFDFDAFDEINVTTGGGDLRVQTGGVGLNFVTKRGSNAFHGSAHTFFSHKDMWQSSNLPSELEGDPRLQGNDKANHIDQINDWGAELSGPIVKDKLWFWGSYGKNDIRQVNLNQTKDRTVLINWNAKLNWQASGSDMLSFFFFNGAKEKYGRSPGQAGNQPDSFLWDQGNFYAESDCGLPCGLHGLFKLEWNHTFSPNLYVNAKYAFFNWGYGFAPRGGKDNDGGIDAFNDTAHGSWFGFIARKPWQILALDGNWFKGNHELKFGFGYRKNPNRTTTTWSGSQNVGWQYGESPLDASQNLAWVTRQRNVAFTAKYTHLYLGDTWTKNRLSLSVGVRWDKQTAENEASTASANPTFPELLPELAYAGGGTGIDWNDVSPRVSFTYALTESRKTVARGSYAYYAGQLNPFEVTFESPVGGYYTFIAYPWVDRNGDHFAQGDEVLVSEGVLYANNVDPANPTSATAVNSIDPNYSANNDHELILGIDHELAPNFAIGAAYTWRKGLDAVAWTPRPGMTQADYFSTGTVSQNGFSAEGFAPDPTLIGNGGRLLTNRPDYHLGYNGIELSAVKRLSNRWMARAAFGWMDWKEYLDGPGAIQNPTRSDLSGGINNLSGPGIDGGIFAPKSYGAKTNTFFNATWQLSANALYQMGAGFEVAAALFGRQGYPQALILNVDGGDDGTIRAVPSTGLDTRRYDPVWTFDFRLSKTQKIAGNASIKLDLDLFNALNSGVVLNQSRAANTGTFGRIDEVISPRIFRLGVRVLF